MGAAGKVFDKTLREYDSEVLEMFMVRPGALDTL